MDALPLPVNDPAPDLQVLHLLVASLDAIQPIFNGDLLTVRNMLENWSHLSADGDFTPHIAHFPPLDQFEISVDACMNALFDVALAAPMVSRTSAIIG